MATIREIAQLGNPVLRRKASRVSDLTSPALQALVDDMFVTVQAANGAGIAAPQVSVSERLFIVCSKPSPRYPYAPDMEPEVLLNPVIERYSEETDKDWEGCLSIPGIRAMVPRSSSIDVSWETLDGEKMEQTYDGFLARVFQHETDHLDGIVYLDRVEDNADIVTEQEFIRQLAQHGAEQ